MDGKKLASYFDHTILKPEATLADIRKLCDEARLYQFFAVCVNPFWIPECRKFLEGSSVQLCTVVNFPLGASGGATAVEQSRRAMDQGAVEIDCVINIGALKSRQFAIVQEELNAIVAATRGRALVKVIVESGVLSHGELLQAIDAVNISGAEFIKTSTGFAAVGATPEAVKTMKEHGRPGLKIKASGGIRNLQEAQTYIDLGVHRIGASKGVEILAEFGKKS
jgi:deoxyribose-phosphate aldolase